MPPQAVIELQNLGRAFGHHSVLSNINLTIAKGESFVVIGPSGLGKSVLLKLMAGLMPPSSGKIFWDGVDAAFMPPEQKRQWIRHMGMLFQKNALFDSLTVAQNVAFPLEEITALSESEIAGKVDYFLGAVGLSHAKNLFPSEISGGMQKRLGIARALALDPQVIFYDDPTAGLDPITSRKIIQLIQELRQKLGSTIVTITNDMNRAYQIADRMGMLVDRELVVTGDVDSTKKYQDPRVQQFIHGALVGPLTAVSGQIQ